jgi:hypothetical protein
VLRLGLSLVGGALGLVATKSFADEVEAAAKRAPGEICRENANCASGLCGPKDRHGRRTCHCQTKDDCPAPRDSCTTTPVCTEGICSTVYSDGQGRPCDPDNPICCGDQVCGGVAVGYTDCRINHAPTACDVNVKNPWKSTCVSFTMRAGDPDGDIGWLEIDSPPTHGIVTAYISTIGPSGGAIRAEGGSALRAFVAEAASPEEPGGDVIRAQTVNICERWSDYPAPDYPPRCDPPVAYPGDKTRFYNVGNYHCADAAFFQRTMCYVPLSSTFTGLDSFTYVGVDEFGRRSEPASVTIEIIEV